MLVLSPARTNGSTRYFSRAHPLSGGQTLTGSSWRNSPIGRRTRGRPGRNTKVRAGFLVCIRMIGPPLSTIGKKRFYSLSFDEMTSLANYVNSLTPQPALAKPDAEAALRGAAIATQGVAERGVRLA
jgi:hypothetical protein